MKELQSDQTLNFSFEKKINSLAIKGNNCLLLCQRVFTIDWKILSLGDFRVILLLLNVVETSKPFG